jgi:hypothetical protein
VCEGVELVPCKLVSSGSAGTGLNHLNPSVLVVTFGANVADLQAHGESRRELADRLFSGEYCWCENENGTGPSVECLGNTVN